MTALEFSFSLEFRLSNPIHDAEFMYALTNMGSEIIAAYDCFLAKLNKQQHPYSSVLLICRPLLPFTVTVAYKRVKDEYQGTN